MTTSSEILLTAMLHGVTLLGVPLGLLLAYELLAVLKARGYRTAYAEALVRAVGAAADAANAHGTNLFTPQGRMVGVAAGVAYLEKTVATSALALGVDDHALRINAQIGTGLVAPGGVTLGASGEIIGEGERPSGETAKPMGVGVPVSGVGDLPGRGVAERP